MEKANDHPGVYIPPPLIYAAVFLLSLPAQRYFPMGNQFIYGITANILGTIGIMAGLLLVIPAIYQFIRTKNTLITVKPAHSLQHSGIYRFSRNPMYLGLLLLYVGLAFLIGNWWTLLFVPLLIVIVTYFVIRPEEKYLGRAFGESYRAYRRKVRRWI